MSQLVKYLLLLKTLFCTPKLPDTEGAPETAAASFHVTITPSGGQ